MAVDGWAVTSGINSEEGTGRGRSPLSPSSQM